MHTCPSHSTVPRRQDRHGWWPIPWSVGITAALGLVLVISLPVQAKTFHCDAGNVACLIAAITEANASGKTNQILLEAGTYTLRAINNITDGPNGLPSVTSTLTITGDGADITVLKTPLSVPFFRLVHVAASGILTLEGLTLMNGITTAGGGGGGGIRNHGMLTVTHCTLIDNQGEEGGGGIRNHGTLTFTNSTLADNNAIEEGGGGLKNFGTAIITNSVLVCNVGNGLHNTGGTVTVINSTLASNAGSVSLCNNTLASNVDDAPGGGILNDSGTVTVTNSTLADNKAGSGGGGIWNRGGTVTVQNTILARNTLLAGQDSDCAGPIASLGNNLIGNPSGCTITLQPTDRRGDPGLGDFTDDGTPGNGHFPLLPTSQAIDAGNDDACPKRDQLGEKRDTPCDIGAIEFQGEVVGSQ